MGRKPTKWASIIFDRVARLLVLLACFAVVFIVLAILFEISTRRFLASPQTWIQDAVGFCLFGMTFLMACRLLQTDQHVRIDLVTDRLRPRFRYLLDVITSLLGVVICSVLAWYSAKVVVDHLSRGILASTEARIPIAPLLALITLAMLMLTIQFLRRAYIFWTSWRASKSSETHGTRASS